MFSDAILLDLSLIPSISELDIPLQGSVHVAIDLCDGHTVAWILRSIFKAYTSKLSDISHK